MPAIFTSGRGVVGGYEVDALPAALIVEGLNDQGQQASALVALTGFAMGGNGSYQFSHSLRDFIYAYVFGEHMGDVAIQGVAFMGLCNQFPPVGNQTGMDAIFDYYNQNRLSASGVPVSIVFGQSVAVQGFLVGFKLQVIEAENGLTSFTLMFKYPPKNGA